MKQPQVLFPSTTGVVTTLLCLLLSSKFVITAGQSCDDLIELAVPLLNTDCGSSQPSCSCETSTDDDGGYFYATCTDPVRLCSSFDSSLCGTQSSIFHYDDYGYPTTYNFFTYDDGVTVMLLWMSVFGESECTANIKDADGTQWDCQCFYHVCSDGSTMMPYVDCSAYQSGAFADGCMDNWGVQEGVMQAFSINSGLCVSDGSTVPPEGTISSTPPTCEEATDAVLGWLGGSDDGICGVQPKCVCDSSINGTLNNPDGNFYAYCEDQRLQCLASDASGVCGHQTSWAAYDPSIGTLLNNVYEWQYVGKRTETLLYYLSSDNTCSFSIVASDNTETTCSCTSTTCTDGSTATLIDCSSYESGAVANGCSEYWGIQGGVLQGFAVTEGLCVPANSSGAVTPSPTTSSGTTVPQPQPTPTSPTSSGSEPTPTSSGTTPSQTGAVNSHVRTVLCFVVGVVVCAVLQCIE